MWAAVLALALVAGADPVRIGIALVLLSRPRPMAHLVALWLGGMTVGVILALSVLFGLHDLAPGVTHRVQLAATSSTAGRIQIATGLFALVIAAAIAAGFSARQRVGPSARGDELLRPTPTAMSRLSARALHALRAGPPWLTFAIGAVITTDFRYLAALSAILASGAAMGTQLAAAAAYTLVGMTFAEVPLVSQLVAPAETRAAMSQVHDWVKNRRRRVLGMIVAVLGVFLMGAGLAHV